MTFTKKDFKIDWFSGTGAGGQHRNKHQNCVRLTHKESGLTTIGQNHKERRRNMSDALHAMATKLVDYYYPKVAPDINTDVVRTYHIEDNRVKDHASGHTDSWKQLDFHKMIEGRLIATLHIQA